MLAESTSELFTFDKVCFSYGKKKVLSDVVFSQKPGSRVLLLGQNGVGKTTLLSCLVGLLRPQSGAIQRNFTRFSGFLGEPAFLEEETSIENLKMDLKIRSTTNPEARQLLANQGYRDRISQLAGKLQFEDSNLNRKVLHLSTGNRKKLALMRVFLLNSDFIVLDEPMSGLNPASIVAVRELIQGLSPQTSLLISSHQLDGAAKLVNVAVILRDGRVVSRLEVGEDKARWIFVPWQTLNPAQRAFLQTQPEIVEPVTDDSGSLSLRVENESTMKRFLEDALAHGLVCRELRPARTDLEQLYLATLESDL